RTDGCAALSALATSSRTGSTRSSTRPAHCARLSQVREAAFFFYGTLMDRGVLSEVLGRRVWPRLIVPARGRGSERRAGWGASYPVVVRERGASVEGVIFAGVTADEQARLCHYEGDGFELVQAPAKLRSERRARVFLFEPVIGTHRVTGGPWSLSRWRLLRGTRNSGGPGLGGRDGGGEGRQGG